VKLGVLFAATGVLATGVAIGPGHQVNLEGVGQAAVTHAPRAVVREVARSSRPDSVEAAKMPQAWRKAAATRPGRASRSNGPAAPSGATRGSRLTAVTSMNAGAAAAEDVTAERHGDASAPERQATGSPENERQAAASSSDGTGSSSHDGQTASASTVRARGGSDGSQSGTVDTSNPEASTSGGDVPTSDGDTSSQSDAAGGVTPAASSAFAADTSAARGDSDGRSRSSDGGELAQPGSGSDSTVSDTSPKGK
jgi:hypothetical protein